MSKEDEILAHARDIRNYCIDHRADEEHCPFFRGYRTFDEQCQLIVCELNKGMCSPCNWEV